MALCLAAAGSVESGSDWLPGLDVERAVESLMSKQRLPGVTGDYLEGYKTEVRHMLNRRLELLSEVEAHC